MPAPTVWVVTPVHNRKHYTEPFLDCLHRQTYLHRKVVIFDDGSTDGTGAMIRARFPGVIVLQGDGNVWWTASVNRAIRRALEEAAPDDYILVMNDDVELGPSVVETLVRFAETHPRALVGSVMVDLAHGNRIDDGGVMINWWTAKHRVLNRGRNTAEFPPGHYERPSYLTGRTCLVPARVFREVGLYDERHFLNCADTELPVRASRRGWELYVCYDAPVGTHVHAAARENVVPTYTVGMLGTYLFGVKSYSRLVYRYYFARTAAGGNPVRFVTYLACDLARILAHFFRAVRLSPAAPGT